MISETSPYISIVWDEVKYTGTLIVLKVKKK